MAAARPKKFRAVVTSAGQRVFVPVPFEPDAVWGKKREHHVAGTVDGMRVRAVIEMFGAARGIVLGPAWRRAAALDEKR